MKIDQNYLGAIAKFREFKKLDYIYRGGETDGAVSTTTVKRQSFIASGTCIDVAPWPSEEEPTPEERFKEMVIKKE